MSAINTNIGNSGYYQLNSSLNSTAGGSSNNLSGANTASLAGSLLQSGSNDNGASVFSSAYLLDLSPEAQKYLAGNNNSSAAGSVLDGVQAFTLSNEQRAQITAILAQFKDEPFTQETYNKIQDALQQAGLSPQQLSMVDKATSFNPTQVLLGVLTGKGTADSDPDGSKAQAKVDSYLQQIVSQWKSISTTARDETKPADSDAEGSGDAVAAAGGTSGS